jgi:hypothetical protein
MIFQRLGVVGFARNDRHRAARFGTPKRWFLIGRGGEMRKKKFYIAIASNFMYF